MLGPRRQGKRASRPGQRLANASSWPSPNGKPPGGYPPAASRVVGCPSGGKPPWGRSPGRGRSRRISFPPRCPLLRLCHAASASRFRSSRVDGPEGSSCLDGLARFLLPEGTAFRAFGYPAWLVQKHAPALTTRSAFARRHGFAFGRLACPCSGGAFPALTAHLSHAEACERRFGHPIRFVSIPPALASGTGRFPGWCPRTDPSLSRRKMRVSIRCKLLISL